ncbi:MAG TPA: hypothetical protein VIP80_13355 [Gemmatimonadales bacterium]
MSHRPASSLLVLFAIGALCRNTVAQELPLARVGARVRLTLQGANQRSVVGWLAEVGPDSLILAGEKTQDRRILLRSLVSQVEVSLGRQSRVGRGLVLGAVGGALFSGAILLTIVATTPSCGEAADSQWCHKASAGQVLGAISLGAASGASLGYDLTKHPRDIWAPARWPDGAPTHPAAGPQPMLGVGMVGGHHALLLGIRLTR